MIKRVGVVSPIAALRNGLESLLFEHFEIERVQQAAHLDELGDLKLLDIVILTSDAGLDSFEPIAQEDAPKPALLILNDEALDARLVSDEAFANWGILPLEASEEELISAINALGQGLIVASPLLLDNQVFAAGLFQTERVESDLEDLTAREIEVLESLAQGRANKQIALELDISEHTVKFHSSAIYSKLGVTNRTEAVRKGVRLGLIAF